jgi:hypothetical protein
MNDKRKDDPILDEVAAMLHDYEGPAHARRRPLSAKRWPRPLPAALALVLVCAAAGSIAAFELTRSGNSHPPAPATKSALPRSSSPHSTEPFFGEPPPAPVSLDQMMKTADIVFVGQVSGFSETLPPKPGLGACPFHYRVERIYRGDIGPTLDVGALCGRDFEGTTGLVAPIVEIGQTYLVFADYEKDARSGTRTLFPLGREQGLFLVTGSDIAVNDSGYYGRQEVRLDTLDQRLAPSESKGPPPLEFWPAPIAPFGLGNALETVTLDQAIADADTIFVGRVMAIGPGKNVSSGEAGNETIVCPVRYRVERMLRGAPADTIDLGDWFSDSKIKDRPGVYSNNYPGGMFPADVGERYLVFAHRTELGTSHVSMLVPEGAYQNVYEFKSDQTAVNDEGTKVTVSELARQLESAPTRP